MNDLDKELLIIISDYVNDLASIKKRDGEFPAQAAVKRLKQAFDKHVIGEDYKFSSDTEPSNAMKLRNNEHARQREALWGKVSE